MKVEELKKTLRRVKDREKAFGIMKKGGNILKDMIK